MPRFRDEVEMEYIAKFPEDATTEYWQEEKIAEYHALLKRAIARGSGVEAQELVQLLGLETYDAISNYLRQWGYDV